MSIVQKPVWHFGGTFDAAWNGTARMGDIVREKHPDLAHSCALTLNCLHHAHVVTLDIEQYLALPTDYDVLTDFVPDPHLPFPIIYVSVGDPLLAGVLIGAHSQQEHGVAIVPFWGYSRTEKNDISANPRQRLREAPRIERVLPTGLLNATTHEWSDWTKELISEGPSEDTVTLHVQDVLEDAIVASRVDGVNLGDSAVVATVTLERALSVVRFLESANVDFEDTPVSRQVRRQAGRKGQPVAQRVYVRSPRHKRQSDGATEHIEFTHRFEVRGHYKHYGEDTRLFKATERDRPHKIIEHPTRGRMVRVWCPDFVKGDPSLPLVIKTRVYKNQPPQEAA